MFGGITANTYDTLSGTLTYQAEYPFTNQITAVTRDVAGGYSQHYVGEYPFTPLVSGSRTFSLYGAEAKFFASPGLPAHVTYENGVFKLDELLALGGGTIGHIFGGIVSSVPNTSSRLDSTASPEIFSVTIILVPEIEPAGLASVLALVGGALGLLERRRMERVFSRRSLLHGRRSPGAQPREGEPDGETMGAESVGGGSRGLGGGGGGREESRRGPA
jgi:hypothetical protein